MDAVSTLMKMKEEIEHNKSRKSRLEGERDSILSSLEDMGLSSIDEAVTALSKMEEEEEEMEATLKEQVDSLMGSYEWSFV